MVKEANQWQKCQACGRNFVKDSIRDYSIMCGGCKNYFG
tara:strand:+ start:422 stop:538 length:117 start_codon:yes stop_codon:yes gene_type:complete